MTTIVAIDGPAGVGKSTASRLVARALDLPHIDTGAMYRAIALKARRSAVADDDADRVTALARSSEIEFGRKDGRVVVFLDGEDVTSAIREPDISMGASNVSAIPAVRRVLVALQQEMGRRSGGVLEGRDIGTKVFPDTRHKFFLSARPEVRARRRWEEMRARGSMIPFEDVLADLTTRDAQDSTRADSPLTWDDTYTIIDTSELTIEQVVDRIVSSVRGSQPVRS